MGFFSYLLNPLINLFLVPLATIIWAIITGIGIIGFSILGIAISLFDLFSFGLLNYVLFGISPGENIFNASSPELYGRMLIISIAVWVVIFFITMFRFVIYDANRGVALIKLALKNAFLALIYLVFFQVLVLVLIYIIQQITALILGNNVITSVGNLLNSLTGDILGGQKGIRLSDGSYAKLIPLLANSSGDKDPFILHEFSGGFNFMIPNSGILSLYLDWKLTPHGIFSPVFPTNVFFSALIFMISGFLLFLPMVYAIIDLIGKVFILLGLYIGFPIVAALSIGDNEKRLNTFREHFLGNLLSITAYVVGLRILVIFIFLGNNLLDIVVSRDFNDPNNSSARVHTITFITYIAAKIIFIYASFVSFKNIVKIVTSFIGISVNISESRGELGKIRSGQKQRKSARKQRRTEREQRRTAKAKAKELAKEKAALAKNVKGN